VKLVAPLVALVLGVAVLPVIIGGGDLTPPGYACWLHGGSIEPVLATIRQLESGGDYTARARGSTASGAYQFLDSSWARYGGYPTAADAPPAVQDAKAVENVTGILAAHNGDVAAVPVVLYIGYVPHDESPGWDTVPYPNAGNVLTPRQYQTRWLALYHQQSGSPEGLSCGATSSGELVADGWSLPGPRAVLDATVDQLDNPHAGYPAWDWIIPTGTPIYAIRGGTVTRTTTWNRNWWAAGCGTIGGGDCTPCGIGVTITDTDRTRWTYCHGSQLHVAHGQAVVAGQQILTSGDTGRSGTPHLHLEINAGGERRCPQPLVQTLYRQTKAALPATLALSRCSS
jgi:murein DD-endopeptidase MepM/ murein hydrolase activator NlpD